MKFCLLIFQQYGRVIRQCDAIVFIIQKSQCLHRKTQTLVKYPDNIFIDYVFGQALPTFDGCSLKRCGVYQ